MSQVNQQQCTARVSHTHNMRLQLMSQLLKAGLQQYPEILLETFHSDAPPL